MPSEEELLKRIEELEKQMLTAAKVINSVASTHLRLTERFVVVEKIVFDNMFEGLIDESKEG